MNFYVVKRLLSLIPVTLGVSLICFMLVQIAPGDPMSAVVPFDASIEQQMAIAAHYGFDQPLPVQYLTWLSNAFQGDLGSSLSTGRPVLNEVGSAVMSSISLALLGAVFALPIGVALGALAGYRENSLADRIISAFSLSGISVPNYWLALVLISVFAVKLGWFPTSGAGHATGEGAIWANLRHMILPAISLSVVPIGVISRSMRSLVIDFMQQEFVAALMAKGLSKGQVLLHVSRNAAPLVLSIVGLQFGYMLGGSVLVETVYNWPGAGTLLATAIFQRDLPLLQGTVLVLSVIFVMTNVAVDLLQSFVDPRISRE